jgi:hypothetical protein
MWTQVDAIGATRGQHLVRQRRAWLFGMCVCMMIAYSITSISRSMDRQLQSATTATTTGTDNSTAASVWYTIGASRQSRTKSNSSVMYVYCCVYTHHIHHFTGCTCQQGAAGDAGKHFLFCVGDVIC